jgi:hypothetical protein
MKRSRRSPAGSQKSNEPCTVWLVYEEFQADTPVIAGIFASRSDAEQAAEECRREARSDYGWVVYGDKDANGDDIIEWHVDVHVEEHSVQPTSRDLEGHD